MSPGYYNIIKRKPAIFLRGRYIASFFSSFLCGATYINSALSREKKALKEFGKGHKGEVIA